MISKLRNLLNLHYKIQALEVSLEEQKICQGQLLTRINSSKQSKSLSDFEFKVFSQWGDDGIVQRLIDVVEISEKTFIEFGVGDFSESNCRFLMMKDNWRGFVIDNSSASIARLEKSYYFWKYHLLAISAHITKDNINKLLDKSAFNTDIGILSVDIDGVDYWVLEAITSYRPRILICEYNSLFGPTRKITVPYDEHFDRTKAHYSNLYFGASLGAMTHLANRMGYELVGSNSKGVNAFFVRRDLMNEKLQILSAEQAWTPCLTREGRDRNGNLSIIAGNQRLELIKGLPVINVATLEREVL